MENQKINERQKIWQEQQNPLKCTKSSQFKMYFKVTKVLSLPKKLCYLSLINLPT